MSTDPYPFSRAQQANWEALQAFAKKHGHAAPIQKEAFNGVMVGSFVSGMRSFESRGNLHTARIAALEALPGWKWAGGRTKSKPQLERSPFTHKSQQDSWKALLHFAKKNGHASPAQQQVHRGRNIGSFVAYLRQKHQRGGLPTTIVIAAEALPGWNWKVHGGFHRQDDSWSLRCSHLQEAIEYQGGMAAAMVHLAAADTPMHTWVTMQRTLFFAGKLSSERVLALEQLPGWRWDDSQRRIQALRSAHEKRLRAGFTKHLQAFKDGAGAGAAFSTWKYRTRDRLASGELPADLALLLEGLDFSSRKYRVAEPETEQPSSPDSRLARGFDQNLENVIDRTGSPTARLPWASRTRDRVVAGVLPEELLDRLEGVELDLNARNREERFEQYAEAFSDHPMWFELTDWKRRIAGTMGPGLTQWCEERLQDGATGNLTRMQRAALDSVPGWVWDEPLAA